MRRSCVARGSIEWERGRSFAVNHVVKWRTWTDLRRCVSAGGRRRRRTPSVRISWIPIQLIVYFIHCWLHKPTNNNRTLSCRVLGLTVELIWPSQQERRRRRSRRWGVTENWNGFWQLLATMTSLLRYCEAFVTTTDRWIDRPTSSTSSNINRRRSAVVKVHLKKHAPNQTQSIVRRVFGGCCEHWKHWGGETKVLPVHPLLMNLLTGTICIFAQVRVNGPEQQQQNQPWHKSA